MNVGKAELQTAPQPQLKESAAIRLKRVQAMRRALGPRLRRKSAADLRSAATQNKGGPCLDPHKSSRLTQPSMETILLIDYTIVLMYCISKSWSGSSQAARRARPQWEGPAGRSGESVPGDAQRAASLTICEHPRSHA